MPAKDQIITLAEAEIQTPGITEIVKESYKTNNPSAVWKTLTSQQRANERLKVERRKRGLKKSGPVVGATLGEFRKDKKAIKIIKDNYGKIKNDNIAKLAFPKLKFVTALRRTEQLIRQLKQDGEIKPMKTFQSLEAIEERPVGRPEFETIRKQTKTRLGRVKKVSDLYKEKQFQKAKKFSGTDLAHRLSLSLNFADDYNVSQLGVERPEINRLLVAPTENKLIAIYKKQKKLIREAKKKGLTKDISKKLEAENLKVSELVSKTDGRLQGIHIDEKTLKAKPVGMNYGFSIDFGLFDKPVKELTEAEVEFINKVTLPEAVKAEQKVDPKKLLKDFEERGLQITKEAKAKILGSFIDKVKSVPGGCRAVVTRALGGPIDKCEAIIKAEPERAAVKLNNAITATKGPLKDLKEDSQKLIRLYRGIEPDRPTQLYKATKGMPGMYEESLKGRFFFDNPADARYYAQRQGTLTGNVKSVDVPEKMVNIGRKIADRRRGPNLSSEVILPKKFVGKETVNIPQTAFARAQAITEGVTDKLKWDNIVGAFTTKDGDIASQADIKTYAADNPMEVKVGEEPVKAATNKSVLSNVGKALARVGAPLPTALIDSYFIGQQVKEGKGTAEIASNPLNWLGLATMEPLSKAAGIAEGGGLNKALRLGLNPATIRGITRFAGLPGLAISTAMTAYDQYQKYKDGEGFIFNLLNQKGTE